MRSKLTLTALVAVSLLGTTAIASAQTQPAPGASSEGDVGPGATNSKKVKSGTTTGAGAGMTGGVAYLHTHQGPGIRVLLHGSIRIDTAGQSNRYGPLEAWFEPGPEPVFAATSETEPTAFVRCMVLPARLRGQSSIRYVREEDAAKPKPQRYTVFVDEPLDAALGLS